MQELKIIIDGNSSNNFKIFLNDMTVCFIQKISIEATVNQNTEVNITLPKYPDHFKAAEEMKKIADLFSNIPYVKISFKELVFDDTHITTKCTNEEFEETVKLVKKLMDKK